MRRTNATEQATMPAGAIRRQLRERFLLALARLTYRFPVAVLIVAAGLTLAAALYTRERLEFRGGRDDLVSLHGRHNKIYHEYSHDFGDLDHLVLVAEATRLDRAKALIAALARVLDEHHDLVRETFHRIHPGEMGTTGLLYLSPEELLDIRAKLTDYSGFLDDFSRHPSLNSFFDLVNREISSGMVSYLVGNLLGVSKDDDAAPVDLSLLTATLRQMRSAIDDPEAYLSPWDRFMANGDSDFSQDGFLVTENQRFALMLIDPTPKGRRHLGELRALIGTVQRRFPKVGVGLTGGKALAYAEEETTARDVAVASVLALASNMLLLMVPFRAIVKPLFAMATLIVGSIWSFGLATLVVGHLNLLSAVFTSILFGIGINFPIHLTARYQEARGNGATVQGALETSLVNTGRGVVAAGGIMMLAFCTPMLVAFRGVAELGFISGLGLLSCLAAALTVYPALITLQDRRFAGSADRPSRPPREGRRSRLAFATSRPRAVLVASLFVSILPWPFLSRVSFDENILRLQPQASEAVVYELKLLKEGGRSANYAVSVAPTLEELRRRQEAFKKLPGVYSVRSIDDLVPSQQPRKREILATLGPLIEGIGVPGPLEPLDVDRLRKTLDRIALKLKRGEDEGSWDPDRRPDPGSVEEARSLLANVRKRIGERRRTLKVTHLETFQRHFVADFADKLALFRSSIHPEPVAIDDVPKTLRDGFIGKSGHYLIQIYARDDIWDPSARRSFIEALRNVDPDVTGGPVMALEVTDIMKRGYLQAAVWSFIAIFVLVLADFRRLGETLLAMLPLLVGVAWTLGVMAVFEIDFNLANLFAVPLIIGMGVDNGVNMIYRFREEGSGYSLFTTAVGRSVTVCSLTTIAGFGALVFARHRGIASLGLLLCVGVTAIFIATVVVLPAALVWLGPRGVRSRPADRSLTSVEK